MHRQNIRSVTALLRPHIHHHIHTTTAPATTTTTTTTTLTDICLCPSPRKSPSGVRDMAYVIVGPKHVRVVVLGKCFEQSQYTYLEGLAATCTPVAVTFSTIKSPGYLRAVTKSKLRIMSLQESQLDASIQALSHKLSQWSQTPAAIDFLNSIVDIDTGDLLEPPTSTKRKDQDSDDEDDAGAPKLPKHMKLAIKTTASFSSGSASNPIDLSAFNL